MNSLTEADRKVLTEFLGEKWEPFEVKEWKYYCDDGTPEYSAFPIDGVEPTTRFVSRKIHTFTSGNDMVALKDKLEETGKWKRFIYSAVNSYYRTVVRDEDGFVDSADIMSWLFTPTRFAWLCAEFLKGEAT